MTFMENTKKMTRSLICDFGKVFSRVKVLEFWFLLMFVLLAGFVPLDLKERGESKSINTSHNTLKYALGHL